MKSRRIQSSSHKNTGHSDSTQGNIMRPNKLRIPEELNDLVGLVGGALRDEYEAGAAGADDALHLGGEARGEERLVEARGEGEVEGGVEEGEVVGVGAGDERRRVEDLDGGDVVDAEGGEGVGLVAGAGGDAEDAGVVAEEGEVTEEEGEGVDLGRPEARGAEAEGALVGGDVEARGEVAGGAGEAEVAVGDARVGRAEEEEEECERSHCDRCAR